MDLEFIDLVNELCFAEGTPLPSNPSVLVITKAGKYLRGHIVDHNVRINSEGRVRGRIVLKIGEQNQNIDANDITSLEKIR